ncbi:hypothetical protein Ancab_032012 [Ancistrocladus abbreviatus]
MSKMFVGIKMCSYAILKHDSVTSWEATRCRICIVSVMSYCCRVGFHALVVRIQMIITVQSVNSRLLVFWSDWSHQCNCSSLSKRSLLSKSFSRSLTMVRDLTTGLLENVIRFSQYPLKSMKIPAFYTICNCYSQEKLRGLECKMSCLLASADC